MLIGITQRLVAAQYVSRRPFERKQPQPSWHLSARLALVPAANDPFPQHTETASPSLFWIVSLLGTCGRWLRGVLGLVFR